MAILIVAVLAMAMLTMATLTMAILTYYGETACSVWVRYDLLVTV